MCLEILIDTGVKEEVSWEILSYIPRQNKQLTFLLTFSVPLKSTKNLEKGGWDAIIFLTLK